MPIYMNYNKIPGDVTADGHAKWIELNSFRFGIGRGISSPTGASADRESSAPSITTIVMRLSAEENNLLKDASPGRGRHPRVLPAVGRANASCWAESVTRRYA